MASPVAGRLVALTLIAATGCSAIGVRGPAPRDPRVVAASPPPCTTDRDLPVVDTVFAVGTGALGVAWLVDGWTELHARNTDTCGTCGAQLTFGIIVTSIASIWAASAYAGFGRTSACRAAVASYRPPGRGAPGALSPP